jgi:aspartate racemase
MHGVIGRSEGQTGRRGAIGILGGMGPEASSYLYRTLIEQSIEQYHARNNADFPEIVLHSIPVPDFISDASQRDVALAMLKERVKRLDAMDLGCLCIACNTAHVLLPELRDLAAAPFVSMIDEVADRVALDGLECVAVLGTPSTIRYGLYQDALDARGVTTVAPDDLGLEVCERIIRHVLSGRVEASDAAELAALADGLLAQGAQGVVLGCTELPLVFPHGYRVPVYDSLAILSSALLECYYC